MAFLKPKEVFDAYEAATEEADQWRIEYPEYQRLADNGLLEDLDENLPEVNDGSLAASLFKLAKRVIKKKMAGRARAMDRDDDWLTELANIYWEKRILKNAKSKASPRRKWKDAVRKAAIFGGQPIITLFVQRGNYRGADFIVPYALDVKLEAGKDSDEDSDIIFWDTYYTKLQLLNLIEQAKAEREDTKVEKAEWRARRNAYAKQFEAYENERQINPELPPMPEFDEEEPAAYNKWNIKLLEKISKTQPGDTRPGNEQAPEEQAKGVKKTGYHFFIAFQRGVDAPFSMNYVNESGKKGDKVANSGWVREWSNPDPTGDVPVHYLYCYQDFINPYGIGIVKLAGGTQNVLDYMRQADILATQIGIRPPKVIYGDEEDVDEESMVFAQDANWYMGNVKVEPWQMATGVYQQLPDRISMYQTSLQKFIPMGDTSISSTNSGDPNVGRTPQALKMADAALSIDDEDFAENVDECYEAVASSMINTQFANMQGSELLKLSEDERDILEKAGIPFELDDAGNKTQELEIFWDDARAQFEFEMDADADKLADEGKRLEGLVTVTDLLKDPATQAFMASGVPIILGTRKLDPGELIGEIISLSTENDKILVDATPEDQQAAEQARMAAEQQKMAEAAMAAGGGQPGGMQPSAEQPAGGLPAPVDNGEVASDDEAMMDLPVEPELSEDEAAAGEKIAELVELFGVDEEVAATMLEAEDQGYEPEEVIASMENAGLVPAGTLEKIMANAPAGGEEEDE